jgi:hypothetical protein
MAASLRYEGNPKHKQPWQRGKRGSICPREIDEGRAQLMLSLADVAPESPDARFAVLDGKPYCARPHTKDAWHGYPVRWREVPASLRAKWIEGKRVTRKEIRSNW